MIPLLVQPISNEESTNILPVPWIRFLRYRFHGIDRLGRVLINRKGSCTWRCPHYAQKRTPGLAFSASALCQRTKPLARQNAAAGGSASKETKMVCGARRTV